jgi:hypothetical protein
VEKGFGLECSSYQGFSGFRQSQKLVLTSKRRDFFDAGLAGCTSSGERRRKSQRIKVGTGKSMSSSIGRHFQHVKKQMRNRIRAYRKGGARM